MNRDMKAFILISIAALIVFNFSGCKRTDEKSVATATGSSFEDSGGADDTGDNVDDGSSDNDSGDIGDGDNDSGDASTSPMITLAFAGDAMLDRNVETAVINQGGGDYRFPFLHVADYLRSVDVAFLNLESIISDEGEPNDLTQYLAGIAFRADPQAMNGLTYAGIDIVSVANNHIFDYGREGMEDCLYRLNSANIVYSGAGFTFDDAYSPRIIDVEGTKIAFLSYTLKGSEAWRAIDDELVEQSGVAWLYTKYLEQGIYQARQQADIVIVSIHFGVEYETLPSGQQDRYAHLAIDRGASLVVGHHPHVLQPVMVYMKGYIAYSLGNFIFDQSDEITKQGMVLEVLVQDKKIHSVNRKYIHINSSYQPEFN